MQFTFFLSLLKYSSCFRATLPLFVAFTGMLGSEALAREVPIIYGFQIGTAEFSESNGRACANYAKSTQGKLYLAQLVNAFSGSGFSNCQDASGNPYQIIRTQTAVANLGGMAVLENQPAVCRVLGSQTTTWTSTGSGGNCAPPPQGPTYYAFDGTIDVDRVWMCPRGYRRVGVKCVDDLPSPPVPEQGCMSGIPTKFGNPVDITGCKSERYSLGLAGSSRMHQPELAYTADTFNAGGANLGDKNWFLDPIDRRIYPGNATLTEAVAVRSPRMSVRFTRSVVGLWETSDRGYRLVETANGFYLYDPVLEVVDEFNWAGAIQRSTKLNGAQITVQTSGSNLLTVSDLGGRSTAYQWGLANLESVKLPSGAIYTFAKGTDHHAEKVSRLLNPDGTSKAFLYGIDPDLLAALQHPPEPLRYESLMVSMGATGSVGPASKEDSSPLAGDAPLGGYSLKPLIGVLDESGMQLSSFQVASSGRTIQTERSGGVGRYQFSMAGATTTVTGPLGETVQVALQPRNTERGLISTASRVGASSNEGTSAVTNIYANDGLLSQQTLKTTTNNGAESLKHICFERDLVRGLELMRIEGRLGQAAGCTSMVPVLGEYKTSTAWHPDWHLKTREAGPKKVTTWVYHGQPDPTASNVIASCLATGATLLPNGQPLAVLCKKIEQATTDETGASGFAATASGAARTWTYTYAADGQVLTANGPRTDIADVTTYQYYAVTDAAAPAKWFKGDLMSVTNAAGHVTTYNEYEPNGKPKKVTDPRGAVYTFTYHLRDWLTSVVKTNGSLSETTSLEYWPTGLLKKVTQPDGSFTNYTYDAAQRLIGITDNLNNTVTYTLDNAGNRIKEEAKDPGGVLKRNIARTMDSLSRVKTVTGAAQ